MVVNCILLKNLFELMKTFPVLADKVFGPATVTESVYEDGVKTVALSALMGINGKYPLTLRFIFSLGRCICFTRFVFIVFSNYFCIWSNQ